MFPLKQKPGVSGGLTETIFHISTVQEPAQSYIHWTPLKYLCFIALATVMSIE